MAIPYFDDLRRPILQLMLNGERWKKSQFIEPLAQHFHLTEDEINLEYDSGNGKSIFADRISWVLSYFALTNMLSRPKRGYYEINDLGRKFAHQSNEAINAYIKQQMALRNKESKKQEVEFSGSLSTENTLDATPRDQLEASFHAIRQEIFNEILDTILSKTPQAFEKLVIDLLQKMGYGGKVEKSASLTKQSRDGGIDGEIREDVLGLGRIFIQAKRDQRDKIISRPDIQGFVGAINNQTDKGVFITTARYSSDAIEYARNRSSPRIVLIDGQQLAEYIYRYDLGMQTEQMFSIKKLDSDFWDEIPDDNNATV